MAQGAAGTEGKGEAATQASYLFVPVVALGVVESILELIGDASLLALRAIGAILRGQFAFSDFVEQMSVVGVDSISIVLVVTCATGAVFSFYTTTLASQIGFTQVVGGTIGYAFLNELGPVLGGVAMAARAGAAIAAELGSMVVTEQVDALRAMAVSPLRYLVAPRVLASVVMLPLLIVLADGAGLLSAALFAEAKGVAQSTFWTSVHTYVGAGDFMHGLVKALVFGFIIGVVSCRQGLHTRGGASGVGRSTTSSVVACIVLIFISDFFLTQVLTHPELQH